MRYSEKVLNVFCQIKESSMLGIKKGFLSCFQITFWCNFPMDTKQYIYCSTERFLTVSAGFDFYRFRMTKVKREKLFWLDASPSQGHMAAFTGVHMQYQNYVLSKLILKFERNNL